MNRNQAWPLYGAAGVLLVALIVEWLPGDRRPAAAPPAAHAGPAAQKPETEPSDTEDWANTILTRPLFTMNRRPAKAVATAHGNADATLPRLSGIMVTPLGRRAIFSPDGGKPLVLAEGASVSDSTIRSIQVDRVVLAGPKGELVLRPAYEKQKPGALGAGLIGTVPMYPQPNFTPPNFQPGFPRPGFAAPGFAGPGFPTPGLPGAPPGTPQNSGDDSGDASPPSPIVAPAPARGMPEPNVSRRE